LGRVESNNWDVVVVGAGAAGLMAAVRAAELGRRVLVLEKNRKPGVKILMSGGTRCNLTQACDNRGIVAAYGEQGSFLHSALASLSVEQTIRFFEEAGVATKVESTGKVFPVSNRAVDVLDALLRCLHRSGATLALAEPLGELKRVDAGFELITSQRTLSAEKVIITSGGKSYPGCGTTGDGYGWATAFGHTLVPPRPALTPLTVAADWVKQLSGITIPDVAVRVMHSDNPPHELAHARGSFLFTHFGLSGPVVLDVSRAVSGHTRPSELQLECDLLPTISLANLAEELKQRSTSAGKKLLPAILPTELPDRLHETIVTLVGMRMDRKAAEITKEERASLVRAYKGLMIPLTGTRGFAQAEVTAGGVALSEVDSRSMQSKLVSGLYLAGEVLDLDGPIGGYNFQAAWSTGWLAGSSV
jgi:predicted Rossmann fold flavoprotein